MTTPPLHAIPVIIADQVYLRIYRGGDLELEMPLRRRQALMLVAQLMNHGLMTEGRGLPLREAPKSRRVLAVYF